MSRKSQESASIRDFLLRNIDKYPTSIVAEAVKKFGHSRMSIHRYLRTLIEEGLLTAKGKTNARRYTLVPIIKEGFSYEIDYLWTEDSVWREKIRPLLNGVSQNIIDLCHYGFTEMLNNVLDHSRSPKVVVFFERDYAKVSIYVMDHGLGIFKKIQEDFHLSDPRTALLELSKGRLTSDKRHHSGEGIY